MNLKMIRLPPPNSATWELLYAIFEAMSHRIRNATLVSNILDRLSQHFDVGQLTTHPEVLRHLATVVRLAGDTSSRTKVFGLLLSAFPGVAANDMFKVYLDILSLVPQADKPAVMAWRGRLRNVDSAHAVVEAEEFVKACPPHLRPVA